MLGPPRDDRTTPRRRPPPSVCETDATADFGAPATRGRPAIGGREGAHHPCTPGGGALMFGGWSGPARRRYGRGPAGRTRPGANPPHGAPTHAPPPASPP